MKICTNDYGIIVCTSTILSNYVHTVLYRDYAHVRNYAHPHF